LLIDRLEEPSGSPTQELAIPVDHQLPALHLGDGLTPADLVLSRELTRPVFRLAEDDATRLVQRLGHGDPP
jgi:hypothetical protein